MGRRSTGAAMHGKGTVQHGEGDTCTIGLESGEHLWKGLGKAGTHVDERRDKF
jgi:hypothetical protein